MPEARALLWFPLALGVALAVSFAAKRVAPPSPERPAFSPPQAGPRHGGGALRWIVAGGGATPDGNQVQLESDVRLAARVLGAAGPGRVLFAGGEGGRAVQVLAASGPGGALEGRLAALFDPRPGRDARYRPSSLSPDGPASRESILAAIEGALGDLERPLTLYFAGHGTGGEAPRESRFATWGAHDLWVEDLAELLDGHGAHRPIRIVMTACYAGGFAELAFDGADPERGPARSARCGLFATTWDRVASGCDPDPDRGAHEGYGIHFLNALEGRDREGRPLEGVDLDGDRQVSLLEAHSRARIASRSLDLPITTSEVFLRSAVDDAMEPIEAPAFAIPEEQAVIDALSVALGVEGEEAAAARIEASEARLVEQARRLDELEGELEAVREELVAALLHRWPVLDDPWHPLHLETLAAERAAIERFLAESALVARESELTAERDALAEVYDAGLVALAPLERLARAHQTLRLAAQLRAEGGTHWLRYEAFLACERGLP